MAAELMGMPLEDALPITRACGHYLNLTGIAEIHHRRAAARCCHARAAVKGYGEGSAGFDDAQTLERPMPVLCASTEKCCSSCGLAAAEQNPDVAAHCDRVSDRAHH